MPPIKRNAQSTRVESLGAALYCALPHSDLSTFSTLAAPTATTADQHRHYDHEPLMLSNTSLYPIDTPEAVVTRPSITPSPTNSSNKKRQSASDKSWDATYERLVEYKRCNGDCLVPWRYEIDPQLGNWVKEQRKKKKNNTLSPSRQERLERLGFVWRVQQNHRVEAWEDVFARLVEYKKKHGNTMVPSNYKDDPKLGRWVSMQRFRQETLSQERKEKLESIGFV